jgi:hypothetical protein
MNVIGVANPYNLVQQAGSKKTKRNKSGKKNKSIKKIKTMKKINRLKKF